MKQSAWLGTLAAASVAGWVLRTRAVRWGASDEELAASLPGDELVPAPRLGYTRGIDIDATPETVWQWLVQIGHDRGGLYSYDWLENLVGCDLHSTNELHPELQHLSAGDLIRLGPESYPVFRAVEVHPPYVLVLAGADPRTSDLPTGNAPHATWQWSLHRTQRGCTRLLVRQRLSFPSSQAPLWWVLEPVTFIMERKMLRGIKQRAERTAAEQVQA